MAKKIRVGIIFGGKSAEHEVSLRSAQTVISSLDPAKYEPVLIGVDKKGGWHLGQNTPRLGAEEAALSLPQGQDSAIALAPESAGTLTPLSGGVVDAAVDVVFPIVHGPFGEDGTLQGLLKLANVPFVGPSVLGSAVGMDKDVMKRLLRDAGIPIGKFVVLRQGDAVNYEAISAELGATVFVKPANLGSSVGVSKATDAASLEKAVAEAFLYDRKVLVEEFIPGREVECAVLGNEHPEASVVGEIIPQHEFYSYEAKYLDEMGALLEIPANIPQETSDMIRSLAIATFKALECEGMGRVDFFLCADGRVVVNEINTIPGFTSVSMYPKLWEASGVSYAELVDRLLTLAIERFEKEKALKTSYEG